MVSTVARGQAAEQLAADYLAQHHGYQIDQLNYRALRGEIDIVARDGEVRCFVEVRSRQRSDLGHPLETIGRTKRQRLIRAARQFVSDHPEACAIRFDVVGIVFLPQLEVTLIRGAYEAAWGW